MAPRMNTPGKWSREYSTKDGWVIQTFDETENREIQYLNGEVVYDGPIRDAATPTA